MRFEDGNYVRTEEDVQMGQARERFISARPPVQRTTKRSPAQVRARKWLEEIRYLQAWLLTIQEAFAMEGESDGLDVGS